MIGSYEDEQLRQLLGLKLPEELENYRVQAVPQLSQGLLGEVEQNQPQLSKGGSEAAARMAQVAQAINQSAGNDELAQRQAAAQQMAQQALGQKQQKEARSGALLGKIASLFIPGGSAFEYLKGRL